MTHPLCIRYLRTVCWVHTSLSNVSDCQVDTVLSQPNDTGLYRASSSQISWRVIQTTHWPGGLYKYALLHVANVYTSERCSPGYTAGSDSSDPYSSTSNCRCYQGTRPKVTHTLMWHEQSCMTVAAQSYLWKSHHVVRCWLCVTLKWEFGGWIIFPSLQILSICQDGTWGLYEII